MYLYLRDYTSTQANFAQFLAIFSKSDPGPDPGVEKIADPDAKQW